MRITQVFTFCVVLCLCTEQLLAARCLMNRRKKKPCGKDGTLCCANSSIYHCVRSYKVRENRKWVKKWEICDKKRDFKKCSCKPGCTVTEQKTDKDHYFPVKTYSRFGCLVYACNAIYHPIRHCPTRRWSSPSPNFIDEVCNVIEYQDNAG